MVKDNRASRSNILLCLVTLIGLSVFFASGARTSETVILGEKPFYASGQISDVPGKHAILSRIWTPGLEEGYVPQGVATLDNYLYISSYRSIDARISTGMSRVYKVDKTSGSVFGYFDLPDFFVHPSGLEFYGTEKLIVSDESCFAVLDLNLSLVDRDCSRSILFALDLDESLKASSVAYDGKRVWFLKYDKKGPGRAYGFSADALVACSGKILKGDMSQYGFGIQAKTQGGAFDTDGHLWLTQSDSKFGRLQKIDVNSGRLLEEYELVAGLEDIGFDENGHLWSVSEAGSRRWQHWRTFYPLVFQVDLLKLGRDS